MSDQTVSQEARIGLTTVLRWLQASTVGMGVTNLLPGVKVPKLVPGSVAEAAGMRKGDVIVAVGDRPISSSRDNVNRLVQYIK